MECLVLAYKLHGIKETAMAGALRISWVGQLLKQEIRVEKYIASWHYGTK